MSLNLAHVLFHMLSKETPLQRDETWLIMRNLRFELLVSMFSRYRCPKTSTTVPTSLEDK
jgi:hypothetical protein